MMADHASIRQQGKARAGGGVHLLRRALATMEGFECAVGLDARKLSGSYLLIEVMNTPSIGPAWKLAPNARPGDGLLDVVLVPAGRRRELEKRLAAEFTSKVGPQFPVRRARQVTLTCAATKCHLDDEFWPCAGNPRSRRPIQIEIGVFPGALRVLVP
jgi:diacylglycerol kinase family enzyme